MSKKFFDKKIILRVVAGIIAFIIAVNILSSAIWWKGNNVTDFYEDFAGFKNITSLTELKEYCKDNKLEYVIKNSKITINEFDATFLIVDDTITPDFKRELVCYELLDNEDMTKVKLSAEKVNHKIKYVYTIDDVITKYTKVNDNYYNRPLVNYIARIVVAFVIVILSIGITVFSVFVRMADIETERKKRNPLSDILC